MNKPFYLVVRWRTEDGPWVTAFNSDHDNLRDAIKDALDRSERNGLEYDVRRRPAK